jgi:Flp pilus assembly protein TadB
MLSTSDILIIVALLAVLAVAGTLLWWDIVEPRRRERYKFQNRGAESRRARARFRVSMDVWKLRKTRRLTDQNRSNRGKKEGD